MLKKDMLGSKCLGCAACEQICQKKCIVMREDSEGFLYPYITEEKCIGCQKCIHVCPLCDEQEWADECLMSYVAYAKDEDIRKSSSSGGIFTLLAEFVIKQEGVVFGAAFDEDMLVHHIAIETVEEISLLRGSKYLQSRIENTYVEVRDFLKQNRKVLFSGTGCQIAGLKKFLGKEYDNLLTLDILCHGVPSPKVWSRYLQEQENLYKTKVENAFFRRKKEGWKKYGIELQFKDSQVYENIYYNDSFMKLFLGNICLRPSCHSCKYKKLDRPSDITIGDAWGIGKLAPDMDDDRGTSIILIHSFKGINFFENIKGEMVYSKVEIDQLLPTSADSRHSVAMPQNRKKFFRKLNKNVAIESLLKCLQLSYLCRIKNKIKRTLLG